ASKDAWGAAFCCGTSSVIRLRALEACGGHFPTESVTEDFLLSLELNRHGWRTVYLNEPLSAGLAPEGIKEYLTQRGRWCLGLMQILRSPWGPLSRGRLSLAYRIGLLKPRGHKFKVTAKGGRRDRVLVQWGMIARFGLLVGLTLAGMLYGSLADYTPERQAAGSTAIVLFWSIYNIVVLLLAMAACVELPRYRDEERLATSEVVDIRTAEGAF